jgi:hypothetical protein
MLKIALLGSVRKTDQGKANFLGNSISKSIKSSSEIASNLRETPAQNPSQEFLFSNYTNDAENFSDVRNFASSQSASQEANNAINKLWEDNSTAITIKNKDTANPNPDAGLLIPKPDNYGVSNPEINNLNGFIGHDGMGNGDRVFQGIPNDGNSDPLYDASKHTEAENKKISDMMTIMNSSSSSEVSNANAVNGEKFTKAFTDSILSGNSLQKTISMLDGKNLGNQTSQAYNTENMKGDISKDNKTNGTAIILRGSNDGVQTMMAKDEENVIKAYEALGFDIKVVHSEKEFETALMDARAKAITDKAEGKESTLATHVISHGFKAAGAGGHNNEEAYGGLAMQGGGTYHEKDVMGDIAGALEPDKDGESPFEHSYNSFTACHSGCMDNKQAFQENNGNSNNKIADTQNETKPEEQLV